MVDVIVAAKGGGSEAKSKFAMLNPSDSIVDWVLKTVPTMGAGWCPPGMLGIGIGGTAEKAMLLAKESLMEPIDIVDLKSRGPSNRLEEMRLELFDKRSEEHTSELQSLMRISYAVFCLKKKNKRTSKLTICLLMKTYSTI